jgi:hypothetical protein
MSDIRGRRYEGRTSKLEDFGGQVLHDGSNVDGGLSTDSDVVGILVPQEPEKSIRPCYTLSTSWTDLWIRPTGNYDASVQSFRMHNVQDVDRYDILEDQPWKT